MNAAGKCIGVAVIVGGLATLMYPQCDGSSGFMKKLCEAKSGNFSKMASEPPLTTAYSDAIHGTTMPPSLNPPLFEELSSLNRGGDGAFILKPGFYQMTVESFALDRGNPAAAGGFYPAPIKGARAKGVSEILKNAELHPGIGHGDIQSVLFQVISGADPSALPQQQAALALLSKDTLQQLHGNAQSAAVTKKAWDWLNRRMGGSPQVQQDIASAQSKEQTTDQKYGVSDTLKTFGGMSTGSSPASAVPRGTWAQMPGGFYVRYLPDNAARTKIQVAVPDGAALKGPLVFDPTQYLAVSGGSPPMRLGISVRMVK